jgi:2-keto-4-pentenoate hydratase/2-oxohepta-3-ene-1,7-dioic acid hydratase in catechol pathway
MEAVAVIGRQTKDVVRDVAWEHVAGLTVGQDHSERRASSSEPSPQVSLARSCSGFGPTGPWLLTPDELADPAGPDDLVLALRRRDAGAVMQESPTSTMV